jgi:hypothetical protein
MRRTAGLDRGIVITLVACIVLGVAGCDTDEAPPPKAERPTPEPSAPDKPDHADWKFVYGRKGPIPDSKREKKLITNRRAPLFDLLRSVYGAAFLDPKELPSVVKATFKPDARRSFMHTKVGIPKASTDFRLTKRKANVSIDRAGASRATADVEIVARTLSESRVSALKHLASLFLIRTSGKWRVVGFEVNQRPFNPSNSRHSKNGSGRDRSENDERAGGGGDYNRGGGDG